jgi:tetratricopeptide (TPR) repeat protein/transglutaminase-like putative cysteine protease
MVPVLLLCWLTGPTGHTQTAPPNGPLKTRGIVAAINDTGEIILFELVRQDPRFAIAAGSAADRAALLATLNAATQTGSPVIVHFDLAGARFAADRSRVIYPVRELEYDGKTFSAADDGRTLPTQEHALPATDEAFIRGMGLFYGDRYSESLAELDTALSDANAKDWKGLATKLRALALTDRVSAENQGPTDAGDRELIKALQDLREWQSLKPDDPQALYNIGQTLRELGAYPEALEVYAAIARGWPDEAFWTAIRTGATERELHHYPQALAALDKLVSERGPQEGMAYHYHRGWTLTELGRYAEATDEFSDGLRDQSDFAWALLKRSCAENLLGRADAAVADQQAALVLLRRFADDLKPSQHNIRRAAQVEAELRLVAKRKQATDAKALCGGYWRDEEGRSRSALLPAELPWLQTFATVAQSHQARPKYETGPPASWIKPAPIAGLANSHRVSTASSSEYLLVDRQAQVDGVASLYSRFVVRPLNPAGVSKESQISIVFDPQREHLRVHAVTVSRGGATIDELKRGRIEVLQREPQLEQGLLDGSQTFHLVMDDVRVGDTIDYSYSLERTDLLWGNRFYAWYATNWDDPVAVSRLRVVVRADQPLNFLDRGGGSPVTTIDDGWRTLEWNWRDIPALPSEGGAPGWYSQYSRIEFSQFADWRDVVNAAWPLYISNAPTPELTALIAHFKSQRGSERERLLTIMRFVQDEIRYTGIEVGDGAYRPNDAATVLQRRWGDCKDKTLLAVTLLRGVGIDADPALVNTRFQEHVSDWLPSPAAFNHAIVRARLGTATYWLDSTVSAQGGDLEKLAQAHYGAALVVRTDSARLELIPPDSAPEPTSTAMAVVDLRRGFDKEAGFTVSTVHRGSDADGVRRMLRETTAQELGTSYLNFYKQRFPGIRPAGPLQIHDDRSGNELRIDEAYEIDNPFEVSEDGTRKVFQLEADSLTALLKRPETTVRATPLALAFPTNVTEQIRVLMPEPLPVNDDVRNIQTPTFRYDYRVSHSGKQVLLDYHYQTFADHVPVEQLAEFLKRREEARTASFFHIQLPAKEASGVSVQKQLAAAAQLVQGESWEKADAAFTALLASGQLGELDESKQHAALFLAGLTALAVEDATRAHSLLKRSSEMGSADLADWRMRLQAARVLKDGPDAAYSLTRIAQKWPETVSDFEPQQVFATVAMLPHFDTSRYELLKALFDAKYKRPGVDPSHWWRDLALMQIDRGDRNGARASLSALTNPYAIISVLADNRFHEVRDSLPQRLDVTGAVKRQIDADHAAMADNPSKLQAVNRVAGDLMAALRSEEALKVTESAIAKAASPDGRKFYKDYDDQYVWALDARSRALFLLGRWDDAVAQLQAASRLKERGAVNVSQLINLADLYDRLQRPADARLELKRLETGTMSPFGEMQRADAELSAALQLGDSSESTRLLDFMRLHQDDAIASYQDALIMADRLDDAAKLLIARLDNPDQRIEALMSVQHYDAGGPAGSLPRAQELKRRWTEMTSRSDVRAAVAKVGSVGTYALRSPD